MAHPAPIPSLMSLPVMSFRFIFQRPRRILLLAMPVIIFGHASILEAASASSAARKVRDLVIYQDAKYYSSFPSIMRRPDGELLVAFRRAPSRITLGEKKESHTDPNSFLVMVRSRDGGTS